MWFFFFLTVFIIKTANKENVNRVFSWCAVRAENVALSIFQEIFIYWYLLVTIRSSVVFVSTLRMKHTKPPNAAVLSLSFAKPPPTCKNEYVTVGMCDFLCCFKCFFKSKINSELLMLTTPCQNRRKKCRSVHYWSVHDRSDLALTLLEAYWSMNLFHPV